MKTSFSEFVNYQAKARTLVSPAARCIVRTIPTSRRVCLSQARKWIAEQTGKKWTAARRDTYNEFLTDLETWREGGHEPDPPIDGELWQELGNGGRMKRNVIG